MPPTKKYNTNFPPSPCKTAAKDALEKAADAVSIDIGKAVKPAALLRQIVVKWMISNGFYTDDVSETADLQSFEFIVKKL